MRFEGVIQTFLNVCLSVFDSIVEGILNCSTHRARLQGYATTPQSPAKMKGFAPEAHPSIPTAPRGTPECPEPQPRHF